MSYIVEVIDPNYPKLKGVPFNVKWTSVYFNRKGEKCKWLHIQHQDSPFKDLDCCDLYVAEHQTKLFPITIES